MLPEQRLLLSKYYEESIPEEEIEFSELVAECDFMEEDIMSDYFMESEGEKVGFFSKLFSPIMKLIKKVQDFIGDKIRDKFVEEGVVQVKKTVVEQWKSFVSTVKKFLLKPFEFAKKYKAGTAVILLLTTVSFAGMFHKKQSDARKDIIEYGWISRKEIKRWLKQDKEIIDNCEASIKEIESEMENIKKLENEGSLSKKDTYNAKEKRKEAINHNKGIIAERKKSMETLQKYDKGLIRYTLSLFKAIVIKTKESSEEFAKA